MKIKSAFTAFLLLCTPLIAQSPNGIETARSAFAGGRAVSSIALSGRFSNSDGQGTFTAHLSADGTFAFELHGATERTESGRMVDGQLSCFVTVDGKEQTVPKQNCLDPVNWLLPMFSLQDANGTRVTAHSEPQRYLLNLDLAAKRVKPNRAFTDNASVKFRGESTDPSTLFLTRFADDDTNVRIPIEVRYSNYARFQGVSVAQHIERFVNNAQVLTLDVTEATPQL